jgi:hypothetical protein
MVVDVCTFNDEVDLWDLHYNVLKDVVDEFRVIAFDTTFSGKTKEIIYPRINWDIYPKAKFYVHTDYQYGKYMEMAYVSPQTAGADHWKLEFAQKESIKDRLQDLNDDDTVIIGDVDEIIASKRPQIEHYWGPRKVKLDVYTYYLNNRSSEEFWGPIISRWGNIKNECLNEVRQNAPKANIRNGWHFTSMAVSLEKKLTDSYTQESYATPTVIENLEYNIRNGKDFLGRPFTYEISEEAWPSHLRENRARYEHLCAPAGDKTQKQNADSAASTSKPPEEESNATPADKAKESNESSTTYTNEERIGNESVETSQALTKQ